MVKKFINLIALVTSVSVLAISDDELVSIIKKGKNSDEELRLIIHPDFNPYRTINGTSITDMAIRYDNKAVEYAIELNKERATSKPIILEDVELGVKFNIDVFSLLVASGDVKTLKKYIKNHRPSKIQINMINKSGITPLMTSIKSSQKDGSAEIIELLLEHGADIDKASGEVGNTPLLEACKRDNFINMLILMKSGASILAINHENKDMLEISRQSNSNLCKVIIKEIVTYNDR